jgi:hypothetical protein
LWGIREERESGFGMTAKGLKQKQNQENADPSLTPCSG